MIDYQVLKKFVLEVLKVSKDTQGFKFSDIISKVESLLKHHNAFPTQEECQERNIDYKMSMNQIIWDFIVDRILTLGIDEHNDKWPWLRLTEFGRSVVDQETPTYYDPDGYIANLESITPHQVDLVIKQYVLEGLNCFRQNLIFAASVMFGAAAEKAVLLLLESIGNAETDQKRKNNIMKLWERPNLPKIFIIIQSRLDSLIKAKVIPYAVHQGSTEHLLSLFEMIRVQRNDAVHPAAGQVNRTKVFLTIKALPAALEVIYHLIEWFTENEI